MPRAKRQQGKGKSHITFLVADNIHNLYLNTKGKARKFPTREEALQYADDLNKKFCGLVKRVRIKEGLTPCKTTIKSLKKGFPRYTVKRLNYNPNRPIRITF